MEKKWYNFFISVDQPEERATEETPPSESSPRGSPAPARTPAQRVAEIASSIATEAKFITPVSNPSSFDEIYSAANIQPPSHGYTILKVAEMLQSEHIRSLAPSVKKSSILLALEAAGVKLEEVIQDAVRRDKALDTYERVQEKAVQQLEERKNQENRQVQAELDRLIAEHRARIQRNNDEVAKEKERFFGWRLKKQQEEQKIGDTVSYFVTENPISTSGAAAAPPSAPKAKGT